jgi:hypothetical protein
MTQTIIPAGYRLSITSWENDADAYHTEIIEGLTRERVEYLLELCKLFYSGSNNNDATFGNMYEYSNGINALRRKAEDAIRVVMEKHKPVLDEFELEQLAAEYDPEDKYSGPEFGEIISDLLHYSENYVYRVYDTAKVEYIPHEIRMDDVTGQFDT